MAHSGEFVGDHRDLLLEFEEELSASDEQFHEMFGKISLDVEVSEDNNQNLTEVDPACFMINYIYLFI